MADEKNSDSYLVMKLKDYLKERELEDCFGDDDDYNCADDYYDEEDEAEDDFVLRKEPEEIDFSDEDDFSFQEKKVQKREDLTEQELIDRINADIAELKERRTEEEVMDSLDDFKNEEEKVEYQQV